MKASSEGAAGALQPPPVGEVGREPAQAGLTGHAYLKGKFHFGAAAVLHLRPNSDH